MKISSERTNVLMEIQIKTGYSFSNLSLLDTSLTHSSYANENKMQSYHSNERLEFLGDAVVNLIVSQYLYDHFSDLPEGELTKKRAAIVCEPSLALIARKINLGNYLLLGKGEERTGGRNRDSILADAFEALTGAIYIDGGLEKVASFLLNLFDHKTICEITEGSLFIDYKTKLQEWVQRNSNAKIKYLVEEEKGPDHDKTFHISAIVENRIMGKGVGKNKKEAEQRAAKEALDNMGGAYG